MSAARVVCGLEGVAPVYTRVEDAKADFLPYFKDNFKIEIISETDDEIVFDMVGVDAPIANALRRILIAEVPTVAIEQVYIFKNTSIIQDEVLAHRIGLIPLNVDPRKMDFLKLGEEPTDQNTLVFHLTAKGEREAGLPSETADVEGESDLEGKYTHVYSSALTWEAQGTQEERFGKPVAPVHGDILLAKLAPGQQIDLEAHAVKGIGKDHAKFSPVAPAAYRLLPQITLSEDAPFLNEEAEALVARCPKGVFDIEDLADGSRKATVARPRDCTICRECIREPAWTKRVSIEQVTDHFIFSIESTGALPARALFEEAIRVLVDKCKALLAIVEEGSEAHVMDAAEAAKLTIAAMKTDVDDLA